MTRSFNGETADEAWRLSVKALLEGDDVLIQPSRLGPTREILHATFSIRDPRQRWVLSRTPAMNPAYAIAELIWILNGRNDSAFPNYWNPTLPKFAGTGDTYHGAYGYRLRKNLGIDQIERAYKVLSNDPESRQVVLQIWDSRLDLPDEKGKPVSPDIPCNICSLPKVRNGKLEWLQIMRSNDVFLGAPHDFFWFMAFQEVMAGWLDLEVGTYVHISDSLHCYEHDLESFDASSKAPTVSSTDDLAIPKSEFDRAISIVIDAMDRLRSPEFTSSNYWACIEGAELPEGYRNMLLIAAADSARRRGWTEEVAHSVANCTNPALSTAWDRWEQRLDESPPIDSHQNYR